MLMPLSTEHRFVSARGTGFVDEKIYKPVGTEEQWLSVSADRPSVAILTKLTRPSDSKSGYY
jgi:hypothetical protein